MTTERRERGKEAKRKIRYDEGTPNQAPSTIIVRFSSFFVSEFSPSSRERARAAASNNQAREGPMSAPAVRHKTRRSRGNGGGGTKIVASRYSPTR